MTIGRGDPQKDSSVEPAELERFAAMAESWWDPNGKFQPLHRFNPVRLKFLRDRLTRHFDRDETALDPLAGLGLLDIGCGGGLVAEPMARLGAAVTGVDALARNIEIARHHAHAGRLAIDYRVATAESLVEEGACFDIVLNLEVVEHVADVPRFVADCGQLVKPGGVMVLATLNRTAKAFALAIVGAEYVLGWLPRGTHHWSKFVKPSELVQALGQTGLKPAEITGVSYNPLAATWSLSRDFDVNYMILATRQNAGG